VRSVRTREPVIAITFDDGPDLEQTPHILSVLADHRAKGTFFVLAQRAEALSVLVHEIQAAGHEVALHGDVHARLDELPLRGSFEVIRGGQRRLERLLGEPVRFFRPPWGVQTVPTYLLARASGMQVIGWSATAEDWKVGHDIDEYAEVALRDLESGGILLLHDRLDDVEEPSPRLDRAFILSRILEAVRDRGWRAIPVGELLRYGEPTPRRRFR
jgi:peptidoglycan/xylan/chitin deacetylase (PgdA/CDA1 family)